MIVEDLRRPRAVLRPVHPHHDAQPLRRRAGAVPRPCTATATWSSRRRTGAISPSTGRTLPDRYIEGTCPICGYDGARGDQCDNCGNQLDPTDLINPRSRINGETPEFVETQHFFLDLPALAEALGEWLDEREASGHLAAQRHQVLPEHPRGHPAAGDDPRHRLGHPGAAGRAGASNPTKRLYVWFDAVIGYLSASIEWARRTGDPERVARSGGTTPRPCPTTSWARTTSPSTPRSGRPSCSPTTARATRAASRGRTASSTCRPRWSRSEFLTMEGKQFSSTPRRRHLRPRRAGALPAGRAALLHLRGRAGEPGHRLHLGRVRAAHQRRAGRRLGQPGQPHGDDDRTRTSARSRPPAS